MKVTKYNKLIRDNIPEIITNNGGTPNVEVLSDIEYMNKLNEKLQEELNEYIADKSVEELADLVEVVYGILKTKDVSIDEFEKIRLAKVAKRGAFDKKLLLIDVVEE